MGYVRGRVGRSGPRGYIVMEKRADAINAERQLSAINANPDPTPSTYHEYHE